MAGNDMVIIPKSTFAFSGLASSSQDIVLAPLIDMMAVKSGLLVVRYITRTSWASATSTCKVQLRNAMWRPDEPDTTFVETTDLALVTMLDTDAAGKLYQTALGATVGRYARCILTWAQGATLCANVA